ncbi:anhydro-N-acetylmuramic acid kinase [Actinoallomurus iriomotensis]|uniref:Anhydro-N-acetylmuramic acid kinase n=1 Tax=Actinoallomurus iriomotensis TaxID=478107 RepID=A0A9W6SGQ3_9ACTN|nr:anhydro-N-acetylmuramic acid kinase [Actinoallomurus iriomotensis]
MDLTVIGMISGTSYDAIDAAAADFSLADDEIVCHPRGLYSEDVSDELRARIAAALPPHPTTMEEVCRLDTELGRLFGSVAAAANDHLTGGSGDLIVSHGQTVFHWVEGAHALGTLQLGAAAWIAEATGVTTVSDLRTRDLTRGGHGAPLASTLDALLVLGDEARRGSLNLGGIANITVRDGDGNVIAYDLGPANALMDSAVSDATAGAERMDASGARAARGTVHAALLDRLLAEPYYRAAPPKSTGKELFHADYVRDAVGELEIGTDDLLATLTELTARLVADACRTHELTELVVAGGGVRNPTLMRRITELAAPARVRPVDDFGLPAQAKEAYLFGLLGYLSVHGLEGTIASATGARTGSILGSLTPGATPLRLPEPAVVRPRRMVVK